MCNANHAMLQILLQLSETPEHREKLKLCLGMKDQLLAVMARHVHLVNILFISMTCVLLCTNLQHSVWNAFV